MNPTSDLVGNVVAAGPITSPLWLPLLQEASDVSARLAPILGVAWMTVQIVVQPGMAERTPKALTS